MCLLPHQWDLLWVRVCSWSTAGIEWRVCVRSDWRTAACDYCSVCGLGKHNGELTQHWWNTLTHRVVCGNTTVINVMWTGEATVAVHIWISGMKAELCLRPLTEKRREPQFKKTKQNKIRREEDYLKREMQRSYESLVSKWDVIFFRYHNTIFHVFIKTETSLSFSLRLFFSSMLQSSPNVKILP